MPVPLCHHCVTGTGQNAWPRRPIRKNRDARDGKGAPLPSAASRRADGRVLRVIKCLRLLEQACYSADDLAGYFRVSKRTVYRDLRLLVVAGVPVMKRTHDRCFHVPAGLPR